MNNSIINITIKNMRHTPAIRFYFIVDNGDSRTKYWRSCKFDADVNIATAPAIGRHFNMQHLFGCLLHSDTSVLTFIRWLNMNDDRLTDINIARKNAVILALTAVRVKQR